MITSLSLGHGRIAVWGAMEDSTLARRALVSRREVTGVAGLADRCWRKITPSATHGSGLDGDPTTQLLIARRALLDHATARVAVAFSNGRHLLHCHTSDTVSMFATEALAIEYFRVDKTAAAMPDIKTNVEARFAPNEIGTATRLEVARIESIEVVDTVSGIDIDVDLIPDDEAQLVLIFERAVDIRVGRAVSELAFHEHDPARRGSNRIIAAVSRRLIQSADRYR